MTLYLVRDATTYTFTDVDPRNPDLWSHNAYGRPLFDFEAGFDHLALWCATEFEIEAPTDLHLAPGQYRHMGAAKQVLRAVAQHASKPITAATRTKPP